MKFKIVILVALIITLTANVNAISAGVSPPDIKINNATPGQEYNLSFAVYNQGNETTEYSIAAKGNISDWITVNDKNVSVKGNDNLPVNGKVSIPKDASGSYKGNILIKSVPSNGTTGNKVSVGVNLPITINVTAIPTYTTNVTNAENTTPPSRKIPGFEFGLVPVALFIIYNRSKRLKRI